MADSPSQPDPSLEITCPCCRTELTVDPRSGEILLQQRAKTSGLSWDEAVASGSKRKSAAEKLFAKGLDRERNADELLESKFREAVKRADKSDTPPPRIFDLD